MPQYAVSYTVECIVLMHVDDACGIPEQELKADWMHQGDCAVQRAMHIVGMVLTHG